MCLQYLRSCYHRRHLQILKMTISITQSIHNPSHKPYPLVPWSLWIWMIERSWRPVWKNAKRLYKLWLSYASDAEECGPRPGSALLHIPDEDPVPNRDSTQRGEVHTALFTNRAAAAISKAGSVLIWISKRYLSIFIHYINYKTFHWI